MNIMHGMNRSDLPRHVTSSLAARLRAMPAVVVSGARQTGKTTLAEELTPGRRRYMSLDDLDVFELARRDPHALLGGETPLTLDEIQREPELLRAIKRAIDRKRRDRGRPEFSGRTEIQRHDAPRVQRLRRDPRDDQIAVATALNGHYANPSQRPFDRQFRRQLYHLPRASFTFALSNVITTNPEALCIESN